MFQVTYYRNFKAYYNKFIGIYWKEYFPIIPSYNRSIELIPQTLAPLTCFVINQKGEHTGVYYIALVYSNNTMGHNDKKDCSYCTRLVRNREEPESQGNRTEQ